LSAFDGDVYGAALQRVEGCFERGARCRVVGDVDDFARAVDDHLNGEREAAGLDEFYIVVVLVQPVLQILNAVVGFELGDVTGASSGDCNDVNLCVRVGLVIVVEV
jgi:hypothetical protein